MNDLLHSFPGQEANEPVFVFARPFPLAYIGTAIIFIIVFAASLLAQYGLVNNGFGNLDLESVRAGVLLLGIFQLIALTVFFVSVFDFYYDILIVTDRRLVDIDQQQLFYRQISQLSLEDVEDVTSIVKGMFPTFFNYGTVRIQTAGEKENFVVEHVRHPREIATIILDLSQQAKEGINETNRYPESKVLAVINNNAITSIEELKETGAILPSDMRRVVRNAP